MKRFLKIIKSVKNELIMTISKLLDDVLNKLDEIQKSVQNAGKIKYRLVDHTHMYIMGSSVYPEYIFSKRQFQVGDNILIDKKYEIVVFIVDKIYHDAERDITSLVTRTMHFHSFDCKDNLGLQYNCMKEELLNLFEKYNYKLDNSMKIWETLNNSRMVILDDVNISIKMLNEYLKDIK